MTAPIGGLWAQLEGLGAAGALEPIDLHFARLLIRMAGCADPALVLAGVVVSQATAAGHVCADLRLIAGTPVVEFDGLGLAVPTAPAFGAWQTALRACPVVGRPGEARPLVLDDVGRLYLHRLWEDERCVAEALRARAAFAADVDHGRLAADLAAAFPAASPEQPDWQRVAAALAVLRGFCVIAGGPGTGKTSTVIRVLALLARQSPSPVRIELAAPTGKAASRLFDAVQRAAMQLPAMLADALVLPAEARTLHRLLGRPRHTDEPPFSLRADVVVVDEASMVDLSLMARLLRALPPLTRLVLLGDKDQLASVEAGAVLADVCGPASGCTPATAIVLRTLVNETVPAGPAEPLGPLQDSVVLLRHSHRFGRASGIGRLAGAVNDGDAEGALATLLDATLDDVQWQVVRTRRDLQVRLEDAVAAYVRFATSVRDGADPLAVFSRLSAFRVLCAVRHGPFGVEAVNQWITAALVARGLIDPRADWFPGRPVLVTQNDYTVRVFNGDVGVALPDERGRLRVCFEAGAGAVRWIAPVRLPPHETVFAMTVHKSQGSEFDDVTVILPPDGGRGLTRELLYTAVTRARQRVTVCADPAVFATTVARRAVRSSGLRDALWD